jgi:hypothetical protein
MRIALGFYGERGDADMNNLRKGIGGILLILTAILGVTIATSMTAQAQYRNDGQWQRRDRNNQAQNQDWRRNRDRDRDQYRARRDDRYNRNNGYGVYGNNGSYGSYGGYNNNAYRVEQSQGYQYGVNTGASDAQRGQSYSPQRSRYYRNASSQAFRDGFVQGYDAGFRQYGGYNGGNQRSRSGSILGQIFGRP